ncbi:hypothetical protein ET007_08970 [Lactococcus garvieae]|uniref:hypothetical protein n=1 Tax=Lactococcus TaxID=1357 RepID=UPI0013FDD70C|nr:MULTISPECIES: hypothetical protein [Lactococcus]MDB7636150.1 hypothetical protein [Lactococcus garvieae]NHJ00221.1 hypothetical protein [Lactococcus garvieae]NHJ18995.1 hypothetical protein [Lactococcus garvieae]
MFGILINALIVLAIVFVIAMIAIVVFATIQTIKGKRKTEQVINKTFNIDSSNPDDLVKLMKEKINEDF